MKTSLFAIALIFLCSCSNVPKSVSYRLTTQQKMQAAHHWDVLADDVAKDVKRTLQEKGKEDPTLLSKPIYLEPNKASLFGKVFETLLITQFVNLKGPTKNESNSIASSETSRKKRGRLSQKGPEKNESNQKIKFTMKKGKESLKLKYGTQIVEHCSKRHTSPLYPGEPLLLAALGHGIYKIFEHHSDTWGLFATAGAVEVINDIEFEWTVPHHEIVITTQLTKPDGTIIYRKSNIYYIQDADFWHYANSWHNNREEEEMPIKNYTCVSE